MEELKESGRRYKENRLRERAASPTLYSRPTQRSRAVTSYRGLQSSQRPGKRPSPNATRYTLCRRCDIFIPAESKVCGKCGR